MREILGVRHILTAHSMKENPQSAQQTNTTIDERESLECARYYRKNRIKENFAKVRYTILTINGKNVKSV